MKKLHKKTAFSFVELSIVTVIIGILMAGIISGKRMISQGKLQTAQSLTKSSPVNSMPDLVLWLETSLGESVTGATNGTNLSNNEAVSSWRDISGNKYNAVQASAANRPTYKTSIINGLATLMFDGANDCVVSPVSIDYSLTPNVTIFLVYQTIAIVGPYQSILGQDSGGWDRLITVTDNPSSVNGGASNGNGLSGFSAMRNVGTPQILSYIVQNGVTNGSSLSINRNLGSVIFTESHNNVGFNDIAIGAIANNCSLPTNAYISEVIVFHRNLQPREVTVIQNYLSQKYNITLS